MTRLFNPEEDRIMQRIFALLAVAIASIGLAFAQAPAKDSAKKDAPKAEAKKDAAPKAGAKKAQKKGEHQEGADGHHLGLREGSHHAARHRGSAREGDRERPPLQGQERARR